MKKEEYLTEEDINKAVEALKASNQEVAQRDFVNKWIEIEATTWARQVDQMIKRELTPFELFLFTNRIAVFFRLYKLVKIHIFHTPAGVLLYRGRKLVDKLRKD